VYVLGDQDGGSVVPQVVEPDAFSLRCREGRVPEAPSPVGPVKWSALGGGEQPSLRVITWDVGLDVGSQFVCEP